MKVDALVLSDAEIFLLLCAGVFRHSLRAKVSVACFAETGSVLEEGQGFLSDGEMRGLWDVYYTIQRVGSQRSRFLLQNVRSEAKQGVTGPTIKKN